MQKRAIFLTISIITIALNITGSGCRGAKDKLVGRYTGEMKLPKLDPKDPNASVVQNFQKMNTKPVVLELRADHSYALSLVIDIEGKWESDGKMVTLIPQKMGSIEVSELKQLASQTVSAAKSPPVDTPMKFNISSEGAVLLAVDREATGGWLKFTKDK